MKTGKLKLQSWKVYQVVLWSITSPRNWLAIPGKEFAIISALCVVNDAEELLHRKFFGEKLVFGNVFLEWFRKIRIHRAWVQQEAYNRIFFASKFH